MSDEYIIKFSDQIISPIKNAIESARQATIGKTDEDKALGEKNSVAPISVDNTVRKLEEKYLHIESIYKMFPCNFMRA